MVRPGSTRGLVSGGAGYLSGMASETISVEEARREIAGGGGAVAVDVRSEEEWSQGHVPGAIHLPGGDSEDAAGGNLPEEGARLMVIADDGKAAAKAAGDLSDQGFDAVAVDGGMDDWVSENFKTQPTADPDEDTELGI
jgi:rhodanese-related sulfurtransferase